LQICKKNIPAVVYFRHSAIREGYNGNQRKPVSINDAYFIEGNIDNN
jgi:hypothetical protein